MAHEAPEFGPMPLSASYLYEGFIYASYLLTSHI